MLKKVSIIEIMLGYTAGHTRGRSPIIQESFNVQGCSAWDKRAPLVYLETLNFKRGKSEVLIVLDVSEEGHDDYQRAGELLS